ncbi:hypothetical protein PRZ48_000394 [Zasmidium cellare]|uniref:Uncharacterized protein n=1 Tax=Zasmidium cellare TaxID=395010 RepID=A0ABR0EYT4_ZASCE|nr:hypothetical protein PRZ48_000394 [Zasmidium cellare]
MDWTGGTRRRFAQGKQNAIIQKQKEHFARARAAQQERREQLEWPGHPTEALTSRQHRPTMASSQAPHARHPPTSSKVSGSSRRIEAMQPPRLSKPSRLNPNMTDEERLLLANRERLLARSDWLGLEASRPARMKFPTASDRDRVGKRRKISKSKSSRSHRPKPARQRSITPLFEHRLPFEPMMSGALVDDEIQVKVGTDAFVSQSQVSQAAQPLANTSMRQPSTEFGPLSEESMLLGADDDGFEIDANGQYLGAIGQARTVASGSEYGQPLPRIQSIDEFASPTNSVAPTFATTHYGLGLREEEEVVRETPDQGNPVDLQIDASNEVHDTETASGVENVEIFDQAIMQHEPAKSSSSTDVDPEEDERRWRRAMRIPGTVPTGDTSVAALRSSSEHITESAISAWPFQTGFHASNRDYDLHAMAANAHPRHLTDQHQRPTANNVTEDQVPIADAVLPRAASELADTQQTKPVDEDRDDEALWRDFILGKPGSDSESSDHENGVWAAEQNEAVERAFQSTSSKNGTEQGRSDKVTVGDSVFAPARLSDDDADETPDSNDESHRRHTTTSMVGHATAVDFEDDEIDDVYPDDSVSRAVGNTSVPRTVSLLNPRRFRRQKSQPSSSSQEPYNPHRFKIRKVERSVW